MNFKKKSHLAFWLIPSFTVIEFIRHGKIKGYFLGAHKPRNMKNVPFIEGRPRIEDLKAKADLVVLDNNKIESFPFFAEDIARLASAINCLEPTNNLLEIGELCAHRDHKLSLNRGRSNYVEKNFHNITENTIIQNANTIYKYNQKDPYYRLKDIDWLKNSLLYMDRYLTQNNEITKVINQCIVVGFDKRYKMPVLGFRKSYGNFFSIIPLIDGGESLISSLLYTIYYKPRTRYITPSYYKRTVLKCNLLFNNFELIHLDILNINFSNLKSKING